MNGKVIFRVGGNVFMVTPDDIALITDHPGVDVIEVHTKYDVLNAIRIETDPDNAYTENDADLLPGVHAEMIADLSNVHRNYDYVVWSYEKTDKGMRWSKKEINPS